jgi:hypothetical protein
MTAKVTSALSRRNFNRRLSFSITRKRFDNHLTEKMMIQTNGTLATEYLQRLWLLSWASITALLSGAFEASKAQTG